MDGEISKVCNFCGASVSPYGLRCHRCGSTERERMVAHMLYKKECHVCDDIVGMADIIKLSSGKYICVKCWHKDRGNTICEGCKVESEALVKNKEMVDHPAHYGGADNPYEAIKRSVAA